MRKKDTTLVRNQGSRNSQFSNLTLNVLPRGCRLDTLEDKEYTVVPMVILTEGVHAGSLGPVFYPAEELSKTPAAWNYKPIVVYHPTMNGESISACDPVIINTRKVGVMMNTRFEKGRLKSEAWIDNSRVDKIDERIMMAIKSQEMMELSTGVFIDIDNSLGEWKGETYKAIARNYRPDHLALLPDQIGACSIQDGAGLLRNHNTVTNEMSFDNIRAALNDELTRKLGIGKDSPIPWVENVYSNFFVYSHAGKLWRLGYVVTNEDNITLKEQAVEVRRITEYQPVTNAEKQIIIPMNRKKIVALLMANSVSAIAGTALTHNLTEEQLNSLKEEDLEAALNGLIKKPSPPSTPPPAPVAPTPPVANTTGAPPVALPAASPVTPPTPAPKPATLQEYIAAAPREMQDVLNSSIALHNEEKERLIAAITANANNRFTKEDLSNRPLGELRSIAALAGPMPGTTRTATANYSGQAPVPVGNMEAEPVLELPVMNFAKK